MTRGLAPAGASAVTALENGEAESANVRIKKTSRLFLFIRNTSTSGIRVRRRDVGLSPLELPYLRRKGKGLRQRTQAAVFFFLFWIAQKTFSGLSGRS